LYGGDGDGAGAVWCERLVAASQKHAATPFKFKYVQCSDEYSSRFRRGTMAMLEENSGANSLPTLPVMNQSRYSKLKSHLRVGHEIRVQPRVGLPVYRRRAWIGCRHARVPWKCARREHFLVTETASCKKMMDVVRKYVCTVCMNTTKKAIQEIMNALSKAREPYFNG
jgi:hypothetical protein